MIILDTDCVSLLERDNPAAALLRERLAEVAPLEAATTIINFEEQMRGWLAYLAKARTLEQQVTAYDRLYRFLDNYRAIPVLPFDEAAAVELRRLQRLKIRVGTMDLKIAAPMTDAEDDACPPVEIGGEPLSEMIIRERR